MEAESTSSIRTRRRLAGLMLSTALAALVSLAVAAPLSAGPPGAIGDVYISDEAGILQFDGRTGASVGIFAAARGMPLGHAWGPDGNLYVVSMFNLSTWRVFKYDGATGANLGPVLSEADTEGWNVGKAIAFGPDGDLYIGNWAQHRIDRYDGSTFEHKAAYQGPYGGPLGTPNDMKFAPNGNLLVLSGGYNQILAFRTDGGSGLDLIGVFAGPFPAQQPQTFAFGPNRDIFVAATGGGGVYRFDGTTGASLGWFLDPIVRPKPSGIVFDNYGRMLVGNYATWDVVAYDPESGESLGVFIQAGSGALSSPSHMTIRPSTLWADAYKSRGGLYANLTWSGAISGQMAEIYRDGARIATVDDVGAYTDALGKQKAGTTFLYQVCRAGTQICSNKKTVKIETRLPQR